MCISKSATWGGDVYNDGGGGGALNLSGDCEGHAAPLY